MGQLISSEKIENNVLSINTANFKQGMYICKIYEINAKREKQSASLTKRIIVQH